MASPVKRSSEHNGCTCEGTRAPVLAPLSNDAAVSGISPVGDSNEWKAEAYPHPARRIH